MHSTFYRRCFLITLSAILAYGLYALLMPLRSVIGWAAVLAFILYPLHERLARRLKGRSGWSAGILTALTPFVVLAPLSIVGVAFAGQVGRLIAYLRGASFLSYEDLLNRLAQYHYISGVVAWVRDNTVVTVAQVEGWMTESAQSLLKSAATTGGNVALGLFGTVVGFFMMLFMLFFFLQDGRAMIEGATRLIPVEPQRRAQLLRYLGDVTRAVVFGVLAIIAAFLPAGAALVLIPAVIYLASIGRWGAAIFLACWTAGMWILENVLRPLLTAHHAQVSTLAIFVGAIGGVAAFGILGLVLGPVLLSFVVALVRFSQENTAAGA